MRHLLRVSSRVCQSLEDAGSFSVLTSLSHTRRDPLLLQSIELLRSVALSGWLLGAGVGGLCCVSPPRCWG